MQAENREYQTRLIEKTVGLYDQGLKSILINSPTGSGKSLVGLKIIKALQDKHNIGVAWVAMRRSLLKQIVRENEKLEVGAEITPISMFEKNLPTTDSWGRPIKVVVLDECLSYDTLIHTIVSGVPTLVPIGDIVEHGVGTHVLSFDHENKSLEWMSISSRTNTGEHDVFEVEIEVNSEIVTITATANHRFFCNGEYRRLDEMTIGDTVLVKNHDVTPSFKQENHHDTTNTLGTD